MSGKLHIFTDRCEQNKCLDLLSLKKIGQTVSAELPLPECAGVGVLTLARVIRFTRQRLVNARS